MIYKVYTFQYEVNKFLYGLGKGYQQYSFLLPNIYYKGLTLNEYPFSILALSVFIILYFRCKKFTRFLLFSSIPLMTTECSQRKGYFTKIHHLTSKRSSMVVQTLQLRLSNITLSR